MKENNRGSRKAKELLDEIGFDDITGISMDLIVAALGATLIEQPLKNSDGKIIKGKSKTLIKINSGIPYKEKRRFTIAHEIGHFLLHDKLDLEVHNENSNTLNWFKNTEEQAKKGTQEYEANDFASEFLMPEKVFREFVLRKYFSPDLIKEISIRFQTSLTSVIYRFIKLDIFPLFVVFITDGIVKYWQKSSDLNCWVEDITKLPPPKDSLAFEYIEANYEFIYSGNQKAQTIYKSTWFKLKPNECDTEFFEYCIPTKQYKTIISVIWEA